MGFNIFLNVKNMSILASNEMEIAESATIWAVCNMTSIAELRLNYIVLNVAAARNSVTIFLLPFCYGWSSVTYAKGDKKALKNISLQIL